jgi:S-adenosyl-L-methionine hydrolase (adenosine-forming)
MRGIIALTTDFGAHSRYVAQMKGAILETHPECSTLDLSHDIPPHSIWDAELFLRSVAFTLPAKAVHLVVVDPGVGSQRQPIALSCDDRYFVGPDNGIFGALVERPDCKAVVLNRRECFRHPVAPTFHGRDVFAPVAALLATGETLANLGSPCVKLKTSMLPQPVWGDTFVEGEGLGADRFGNITTNLRAKDVAARLGSFQVIFDDQKIPMLETYADCLNHQNLFCLEDSDGYLELACHEGSMADLAGKIRGLRLRCESR